MLWYLNKISSYQNVIPPTGNCLQDRVLHKSMPCNLRNATWFTMQFQEIQWKRGPHAHNSAMELQSAAAAGLAETQF